MFVNYVRDSERSSPLNLAVGRLVIGVWLVWKTMWYDWQRIVETPYQDVAVSAQTWAIPASMPWLLTVEKYLLIVLLLLFVVGYRIRATAVFGSAVLTHLTMVRSTLVGTGETENLLIGVLLLVFFGLYAEEDELSIDGLRRVAARPVQSTADQLSNADDRTYHASALRYSLLLVGILYFSSGLSKIIEGGGLTFAAPDTLSRLILVRSHVYPWYELQMILVEYPLLAGLGGLATLVLELGFIVAVGFGVLYTPFMLGLFLFVLSNALLLGILFADNLFIIGLFAAYDSAFGSVSSNRDIDLVFDGQCLMCVQSLYPFKLLDQRNTVQFIPQAEAPAQYRQREDVEFGRAMYVFDGSVAHEGYYAFVELLRQFGVLRWVARAMTLPVVEPIGTRVYRYVADNRDRVFTCAVDETPVAGTDAEND